MRPSWSRAPRPIRGSTSATPRTGPFIRAGVVVGTSILTLLGASAAGASGGGVSQVRSVYLAVMTADYYGPASGVCSHLSRAGIKSYTSGGKGTCARAFVEQQRSLQKTTKNVDNTGYTPGQWNTVVSDVMSNLTVTIHAKRATVTGGQSGIRRETLVKVKGRWLFNGYPPSVGP